MHLFDIRALKPADDTPEAIDAALAATRGKIAEAEALARVAREREAQARLDAQLAAMSAQQRAACGIGQAAMPGRR
jgi:hypothetical protein